MSNESRLGRSGVSPRPPVGHRRLSDVGDLEREAPVGSRWVNRWTGREDVVLAVGPCANLDGALRVWLAAEHLEHPSNGWSPDWGQGGFFFCWERHA